MSIENITPGGGQVRAHHALHADRQGDLEVVEALVDAIGDRPVGEQRGEAALAGVEQDLAALDVQIRFLLAGEAGVGQVLGRGAAAHGDVDAARRARPTVLVGLTIACCEVAGSVGLEDRLADPAAALTEVLDVAGVQALQGPRGFAGRAPTRAGNTGTRRP